MAKTTVNVIGKTELQKYREGGPLTPRQAIVARCCHCMEGYQEGTGDCLNVECPLHPFMPYRGVPVTRGVFEEPVARVLRKAELSVIEAVHNPADHPTDRSTRPKFPLHSNGPAVKTTTPEVLS
jgi:hypothetical protein